MEKLGMSIDHKQGGFLDKWDSGAKALKSFAWDMLE
jgi:hypothetical protein